MKRLVMVGKPGSGKGTQAGLLAERYSIPHISTGDIFRDHMRRKTPLGIQITESMNAGKYTSDEITNAIILERLNEPDTVNGYLLDGYPRTINQAQYMLDHDLIIDTIINLEVSNDECVNRLLARASQTNRGDDTEEVIRTRMGLYEETVVPLLKFYETTSTKIVTVDGTLPVRDVNNQLVNSLDTIE